MFRFIALAFLALFSVAFAFAPVRQFGRSVATRVNMADVEIIFPNGKKTKAASGSSLKEAAKKAGFSPNYGCEDGKCGSCELKVNGKTKIRPCVGKVPAAGPVKLENP